MQEKISDMCFWFGSEYLPLVTAKWTGHLGSEPQHMTDIINHIHVNVLTSF
jgi:hypothetical protein